MFGAVDAALHVRYAELMGVPPVWEPPASSTSPPAVEVLKGGMQGMMSKVMEIMAGGGTGVNVVINGGGDSGTSDGAMQIVTGDNLQEMLMGVQKQQEEAKVKHKEEHTESSAPSSGQSHQEKGSGKRNQKDKKSKMRKETRGKENTRKSGKKNRGCWVEDKSGTHMCKADSDCGVDGHSCKQRVCSQYGDCTDPDQ